MYKIRGLFTYLRTHAFPLLLILSGGIGFIASFILTLDKIKILQDPSYVPPCNINPIISCGSVMKTEQASIFGFTNSLLGIPGFAILAFIGIALLAGAVFKRWLWQLIQLGAIFGIVFVHWLIYQSLYQLGTLCPYCVAVWIVTIPTFLYITLYNMQAGNLPLPKFMKAVRVWIDRYHGDVLLVWYIAIAILIAHRFSYYFATFL